MTLLETLVAVAILALISAVAFPLARGDAPGGRVRTESAALVADLRRSRAAAIRLGRPVTLAADADGGGWRWDGGALRTSPGVTLRSAAPVTFWPDGSAQGGPLTLGAARGGAVTLEVDRATGVLGATRR